MIMFSPVFTGMFLLILFLYSYKNVNMLKVTKIQHYCSKRLRFIFKKKNRGEGCKFVYA